MKENSKYIGSCDVWRDNFGLLQCDMGGDQKLLGVAQTVSKLHIT